MGESASKDVDENEMSTDEIRVLRTLYQARADIDDNFSHFEAPSEKMNGMDMAYFRLSPREKENLQDQMIAHENQELFLLQLNSTDQTQPLHYENSIGQVAKGIIFRHINGAYWQGSVAIDSQSNGVNIIPRDLVRLRGLPTTPCHHKVAVGGQGMTQEIYEEEVSLIMITPTTANFPSRSVPVTFMVSETLGEDEQTPLICGQIAAELGVRVFLPWVSENVGSERSSVSGLRRDASLIDSSNQDAQPPRETIIPSLKSMNSIVMDNETKNGYIKPRMPSHQGSIFNIEPTKSNDYGLTSSMLDPKDPSYNELAQNTFNEIVKPALELNQAIPINASCSHPVARCSVKTREGVVCHRRAFNFNDKSYEAFRKQVEAWKEEGVIRVAQGDTSWNFPAFPVPKYDKEGNEKDEPRIVIDFRWLNENLLETISGHIPSITTLLQQVQEGHLFSSMDLESAFTKIIINEEDIHKLTFSDPRTGEKWQFARAPFGMSHLPDLFQYIIQCILAEYISFVKNYLDDLFVYTKPPDQRGMDDEKLIRLHCEQLVLVLNALTKFNLRISLEKSRFMATTLSALGHVVSKGKRSVDRLKIKDVEKLIDKIPTRLKDIQKLLGTTNFLRNYVPNYAFLMNKIEECRTEADIKQAFVDKKCREILLTLVKVLHDAPTLELPHPDYPLIVGCDASKYAIGAVLYQEIPNNGEEEATRYVEFLSKRLSAAQQRYSATHRELLAIVYPLLKWKIYLKGRKFKVRSDHKALSFFKTQPVLNDMHIGWGDVLLGYDFDVEYIAGKSNVIPDNLTRHDFPLPDNSSENDQSDDVESNRKTLSFRRLSLETICSPGEIKLFAEQILEKKLISPEEEEKILSVAHAEGHFGADKMVAKILREGNWFPNIRSKAENHIAGCMECLRYNIGHRGYQPQTRIQGLYPFDACSMDIIDFKDQESEEGYKYAFLYIDACTRYVILEPLLNMDKYEVATVLWKCVLSRFGPPRRLVSDNGTHFVNDVLEALTHVLGISHNLVSPYHPASNGLAESHVKSVKTSLKKMLGSYFGKWAKQLPVVQMALNNNISSTHGSVPASLLFNKPIPAWVDHRESAKNSVPMEIDEVKANVDHMVNNVYPLINEVTIDTLDAKRPGKKIPKKIRRYEVGQKVMWRNFNKKAKSDADWVGPYTVSFVNSRGGAFLRDALGEESAYPEHPDSLKPIKNIGSLEGEREELKNVLDHKEDKGTNETLYLVVFKDGTTSWIPTSNFDNRQFIADYHKSRLLVKKKQEGSQIEVRMKSGRLTRHNERVLYWTKEQSKLDIPTNQIDVTEIKSNDLKSNQKRSRKRKAVPEIQDKLRGTCYNCKATDVDLYLKDKDREIFVCGKAACYSDFQPQFDSKRKRKYKY